MNVFDGKDQTVIILDDLVSETDVHVSKIFTKLSLSKCFSVVSDTKLVLQGQTHQNNKSQCAFFGYFQKRLRHYTDCYLARQMFSGQSSFMMKSFRDASLVPFGYLLIDFKPDIDERCRLRTNIFPGETHYVYIRK